MIMYECHKGWHKMIDSCLAELKAVGVEDRHILQVKEKMAELRIYFQADHLSEERRREAREIADRYLDLSRQTCERCGAPGLMMKQTSDVDGDWYYICCVDCNRSEFAGKLRPVTIRRVQSVTAGGAIANYWEIVDGEEEEQ